MTQRPTLPEPVEIAKFWKSRQRTTAIVVKRLPELSRALQIALDRARALGLIDDEGAGT